MASVIYFSKNENIDLICGKNKHVDFSLGITLCKSKLTLKQRVGPALIHYKKQL